MWIIPVILAFFLFLPAAPALSSGNLQGQAIGQIGSLDELQGALNRLHSRFNQVQESRQFSFDIQRTITEQSGEFISRLVDMSQSVDLSLQPQKEAFKTAFLKNADLLRRMITYNQTRVDDMLEARLEQIQDKDAFFASPEWEQPQYLISVASYWLGWNNYYAALLYQAGDKARTHLLEEAVSGFTRTLPGLQEQSLANRCIFGRALCFKEQKKYDQALQDIQSLMAKVPRGDVLYMQAGYEQALISHLSGKDELAVKQVQELQSGGNPGVMPQPIRDQLKNLQTSIALDIAGRKTPGVETGDNASYKQSLRELRRIAGGDATQVGVLYRYVFDHAEQLQNMPEAELGSIGGMAIADWLFDRKEYAVAGERYQRLYSPPDSFINAYLDGLCFRLAYCYSQRQQWPEALSCLETLFQKYPGSSFGGKAACLYHVVAARAYQVQTSESTYARYVKAAECYVKNCPEDQDKSEAYFQLGQYHQRQGRFEDAHQAFTKVGRDSAQYDEAQQEALRICANRLTTDVEAFEALIHQGQGQSEKAAHLYRESLRRAEDCHQTVKGAKIQDGDSELAAYVTLLLARLYLHAAEPTPRKALPLLRGFENQFTMKAQQEALHAMARKLRLECYLQLALLKEADQEVAALTGAAALDKTTWAFLAAVADRYYFRAKEVQSQAASADTSRDAQAALVIYRRLAERSAKDSVYGTLYDQIRMRLAELYTIDHQPAQAAAIYQETLQRDPSSADALHNLAAIYEAENRWEDAFTAWNKLARGLDPGSNSWYGARLRMAQALIRLGKHKEACEVTAVTTSRDPDPEDQALKGAFLKLQGEFCAKPDAAETVNE